MYLVQLCTSYVMLLLSLKRSIAPLGTLLSVSGSVHQWPLKSIAFPNISSWLLFPGSGVWLCNISYSHVDWSHLRVQATRSSLDRSAQCLPPSLLWRGRQHRRNQGPAGEKCYHWFYQQFRSNAQAALQKTASSEEGELSGLTLVLVVAWWCSDWNVLRGVAMCRNLTVFTLFELLWLQSLLTLLLTSCKLCYVLLFTFIPVISKNKWTFFSPCGICKPVFILYRFLCHHHIHIHHHIQ